MGDYEQVEIPADDVPDAPPVAPGKPPPSKQPSSLSKSNPSPTASGSKPKSGVNAAAPKESSGAPLRDDDINLNSDSAPPPPTASHSQPQTTQSNNVATPEAKQSEASGKEGEHKKEGFAVFFKTKFPKVAYAAVAVVVVTLVMTLVFAILAFA